MPNLRIAATQALEALINARDTTDSDTLFVEFDVNITALRAALAQQDAQKVPQGWQPIETAPMDGTVIDLWHEEFGREADCYWGLPHHCCGEMGSLCDSDWHSLEPGWVGTFNEIMSPASTYTHWMPPPPAPYAAPTPPAQRVMLTDEEIEMASKKGDGTHSGFARAVIGAYERKNGKDAP